MFANWRYGRIGLLGMPQLVLEDVIAPPSALLGYLLLPVALWLGILAQDTAIAFLCLTFLFGTGLSAATLALEEAQLRRTGRARTPSRLKAQMARCSRTSPMPTLAPAQAKP